LSEASYRPPEAGKPLPNGLGLCWMCRREIT
jgi:hypothetical protein